ncbi:MAG: bacillithiol biosynthesis deacetylase BshB1 [Bacteroidetes bacterium]|nr:bacillithiol biosynthesis deacetylase BshB1 [Bacteroidota bacterium]
MSLEILAFGAHPDDVEMGCSGTLLTHVAMGKKFGIIDLTRGELGTRGTPEIRTKEAAISAGILGASVRENLGFRDGFFANNEKHQMEVIKAIRKYRPQIVFANATVDRHPDHIRGAHLIKHACFLSGLEKIKTALNGKNQEAWRPKAVYHYIQFLLLKPDFLVDISGVMDKKMEAIGAFASQFHNPHSREPETVLSVPDFFDAIKGKNKSFGRLIGVEYAEGFVCARPIGVRNLFEVL